MSLATKQKKKHIKAVSQKLRLFRAKEPVLSVFMWGINHSINELVHVPVPAMLMSDNFKAHSKIRIDNHLFNKDVMPSHFKFKEYCPIVFRNLRERFSIDEETYMISLTKHCPGGSDSPGRSGARFLVSYDSRFVIKTIVSEEVAEMHRILKEYHQYIVETHANTLLPQYLGMYRVTVNDQETYMVVMRNVFSHRLPVHKKYDLKGSTVARQASDKEKMKNLPTYKDNDFINDSVTIYIGADSRERLMSTITQDVEFLSKLNLMDYSLLVGIHDCDCQEEETSPDQAGSSEENGFEDEDDDDLPTPPDSPAAKDCNMPAFGGEFDVDLEQYGIKCSEQCVRREIYFMALIDILTHYGMKKRTAAAAKTVKHGAGAEISTVKPEQYARRFLDFISKNIE